MRAAGHPADQPAGERPTAETILRRADLVRNPALGTALEIDLAVVDRASGHALRRERFFMLTRRGERTLLLMATGDGTAPAALLIAEGAYWLLMPGAERPLKLALQSLVAGDLSHAGFLRVSLRLRFAPRLAGEETLGGVPCWRLELEPRSESEPESEPDVGPGLDPDSIPFRRVRYWVARDGFLPVRIEFYGGDGELLKTARFTAYRETGAGPRPARIEIEDRRRPGRRVTLTMNRPRAVRTSKLEFALDDLAALRDVAAERGAWSAAAIDAGELVDALIAAARAREP